MKLINLFLMDMSMIDNTSGVDRYMETLLKGLEMYPFIRVHWIQLQFNKSMLFHSEEQHPSYTKITIPLPQQSKEIISRRFWIRKYNQHVYHITKHLFKNKRNCILHLHTINLIDLALYIREKKRCKIVNHLHCIPWKGLYNGNMAKFNMLYKKVYLDKTKILSPNLFVTNNCEVNSYRESDHVVCVTHCAVDFLKNVMGKADDNISVISNGINDFLDREITHKRETSDVFNILYVGVLSKSKGLNYILNALRKVQQKGYKVSLTVAGKTTPTFISKTKKENSDLTLNLLGRISFDELKTYYCKSDAGVIASLQEQSSYVAIEMAMFGLPVITTAVDGLDEIFTDNVNALKVGTIFSEKRGLSVNVDMMADKIIMLIENSKLRKELSKNVRELYKNELTLQHMMNKTVSVYQKMIGGENNE